MANNYYNFVNIEGNQTPLFTRTEILSGEDGIVNTDDRLTYVFGTSHPSSFSFDLGEEPDTNVMAHTWGRYDVPGIKRNRDSYIDPDGAVGYFNNPVDEAGIYIRNTSQFEIQVMGYFGNNFDPNTAVVASAENPKENVGYWAQVDSINKIQNGEVFSRRYAWMHDQYGNEMERIYLYVQYTNNTVLQNATESTKATIESDAIAGNDDYNIEIARLVGSALQIPTSNDNFLFTSPDDTECVTQDYGDGVIIGQINIQVPGGVYRMQYEGGDVSSFQSLEAGATYTEYAMGTIVDRAYLLIDTDAANNAEKNIIVDHSSIQNTDEEGFESDSSEVSFIWPTLQGTVTKITFFAMSPATGILSGSVEGSFLSGATVTGTDAAGNEMTVITNSNGYYEFPNPAVGEIKARGGSNEITGENYDEAGADEIEIVTQDLVTDSSMGGIISPVSTLLNELKNNEGLDNDEALELLAEQGQELFDLPSNLADKSKIKQYLQIGLNGLQNSEVDDVEEYTGFLQLSKKIAEQEQLFVDTNLASNTQSVKKKRASSDYRQSLTRFMKRKKDDDVAKYKTDYLAKAGTDSTASAINDSTPSQKDQFYLVLADAVEKVDGYVSDNERLASSKADFKLKAKEMMEETIDNTESISTSGKDYETIAIELNEAYMKRKMAAREEQHARYQGNKSTFVAKKNAQTFAINKTSEGYVRSGSIIKQMGESKLEVSSNAKTRSTFLENTKVAKYNSKIIQGGVEKQLQKKSTGEVRPEVRETENSGVTGLEIRNPNYVILSVGMVGFDNASSFGGNSNSYSIEASSGIKMKGRGLNNTKHTYNFIIRNSNGKVIAASYDNGLEFRRVANAFVELYSVHGSSEVQETEVFEYLNPFIVESIDSDGDGVVDSLDDFPNDPTKFEHTPFAYTIDTTLAGDSLTQRFGTGLYHMASTQQHMDLDNENKKLKIDWGEGAGWEYYGKSDSVAGRSLYNTQRYNFEHTYAAHGTYQIRVSYEYLITAYPNALTQPVPQGIGDWVYSISSTDWAKRVTSVDSWGDINTIRLFTAQGLYNYLENCQSWPAVDTSLITEVPADTFQTPFLATTMGAILHTAKYVTSFNASDWNLTQGKSNKVIETSRYYNRFRDTDRLETLNLNGLEYDKYSSAWPDDHGYFGSLVPNGTLVGFNDITIDQDGGTYNSPPNNNGGFQGYLKGRVHKDSTFNNMSINNAMDDIWRANPTSNSDIITDDSTYTFQQKNWIDTSGENRKLKVKNLPSFNLKGTNGEARTSIDITVDLTSPNGWELHGSMLRQWYNGPQNSTLAAGTNLTILGTGNWDTSNVTQWYQFMYAVPNTIILDMDISSWSFEVSPTAPPNSFSLPTLKSEQYTKALIAWAASEPSYSATINLGNAQYDYSAHTAKMSLINDYGWTITDGGNLPRPFILRVTNESEATYTLSPQISGSEGIIIEWGDGNTETVTWNVSHTFSAGTYDIKIHPTNGSTKHTGFRNYWDGNTLKNFDTAIIQWGDTEWENSSWFRGKGHVYGQKMKLSAPAGAEHAPNLSNVTSLENLFASGSSKTSNFTWEDTYGNLADWDVSGITSMRFAFYCLRVATENALPASIDLTKWDMSNVTDISYMFAGSGYGNGLQPNGISADITGWNTGNVIAIGSFVKSNNGTILGLDTLNTTNITSLAYWDKGGFDMKTKIVNAGQANEYVAWDVSNVTNFTYFMYGSSIGGDSYFPTNWKINTEAEAGVRFHRFGGYNGAAMNNMTDTEAFATKTISASESPYGVEYTAWDMSNASDISYFLYSSGGGINMQDWNIASWQISNKLQNAYRMFASKSHVVNADYSQDLGHWDISGVTTGFDFINGKWNGGVGCTFTTEDYDSILEGWGAQTLATSTLTLNMGQSKHTSHGAAEAGRNALIAQGMTITDGGPLLKEFFYDGGDGESSSSGACSLAATETRGYFYGSGSYPAEGDEIYIANSRSEDNYLAEGYYKIATADNTFSYAYTGGDGSIEEFGECSTSVQYNYGNADRGQEGACNARSLDNTFYVAEEIGETMPSTLYSDAALTTAINFSRSADGYYPFQLNGSNTRQTFNLSRGRFGAIGSCR